MRFVDANVLLYAVSTHPGEQDKAQLARQVLDDRELTLSVQVLGEFYVQATRRGRTDRLTHHQAVLLVESFTRFRVQPLTHEIVRAALSTRDRFDLSYWDAAIVEAARAAGSDVVLTEDLQDGQDLAGVVIVNPFR